MQVHLSGRADFTETTPGDPMFRGTAFFTSFIAAGVETDLMAAPHFGAAQFRADNLSEVRAELIAENCGVTAVATQFSVLAALPPGDSVEVPSRPEPWHSSIRPTARPDISTSSRYLPADVPSANRKRLTPRAAMQAGSRWISPTLR